jgi:hypothetical protein
MSTESMLPQPVEDPPNLLRPRRRRWPLVLFLLLALAGAGGVYALADVRPLIQSFVRETSGGTDPGDRAAMPDLLASQQKTAEDVEALSKSVSDQQEQLKTVIDQIAALSAKVDAWQQPAPAALPAPVPQQTTAPQPPSPRTAHAAAKPKKPAAPRAQPPGPISTGGAPLNVPPDTTVR